jgi:DNA-binding CsgD family transcriptional regulator
MTTISAISKREQEILHLISYEYSSINIAEKLFISINTVITHRKNLLAKLNAKNTAGLIRRGFELGYLKRLETNSYSYAS